MKVTNDPVSLKTLNSFCLFEHGGSFKLSHSFNVELFIFQTFFLMRISKISQSNTEVYHNSLSPKPKVEKVCNNVKVTSKRPTDWMIQSITVFLQLCYKNCIDSWEIIKWSMHYIVSVRSYGKYCVYSGKSGAVWTHSPIKSWVQPVMTVAEPEAPQATPTTH